MQLDNFLHYYPDQIDSAEERFSRRIRFFRCWSAHWFHVLDQIIANQLSRAKNLFFFFSIYLFWRNYASALQFDFEKAKNLKRRKGKSKEEEEREISRCNLVI